LHGLLAGLGREFPEFNITQTVQALERLAEIVPVPRAHFVPCHNDLLADNFILANDVNSHNEPVHLIDWEYGGMNSPNYEIGDMFEEIHAPPDVVREILRVYWEDRCLDEHIFKTDAHRQFADFYWFLWSLI
jgi:thiamine kinase-like enzyme